VMIPAPVTAARAALAPGRSAPATSRGVVAATDGRYGVAAAVASAARTMTQRRLNPYDRETFKFVTTQQALELLRRELGPA